MADMVTLPDVTQGDEEPDNSRLALAVAGIGALATLLLYGVLFPGSDFPVLGEVIPLFDSLAGSGIWYFLVGIGIGVGMLFATLLGEMVAD